MTEEEKNIEMQVRIAARLGVLKNLGQDKGDAASVAKIEEELEWLCSLFDCEKDLMLTWEDIRLICEIDEDMHCHSDWPLRGQEVYYEEVLRRFSEMKNK